MASGDSLQVFDALANRPPAAGYATVDLRNDFVVLDFDDTLNEMAQFHTTVPSHYGGGSLTAHVTWTSTTATTGNVKLRTELTRLAAGANLDSLPAVDGSDNITIAAPATSGDLAIASTTAIAVAALAAGDALLVAISRLAADAADTLVGDVEVVAVEIREA